MAGIIIQQLFFLLGGLTVFMIGMSMMGSNLEQVAGSGLRKLMSKASANRFVGVGTGTLITAIVNSSSATTIMIVGFVNIGLLSLTQATPIIMGANIGTTLSAFIMALSGGDGFSVAAVFAFLAFVGLVLRMFAKADKMHFIGNILVGIGFIFVGLNVMSGAVNELIADEQVGPVFQQLFTSLAGDDPQGALSIGTILLLFFLGMALTAVLQASSAITGIMITLASAGLVSVNMAMFVVLGTNIGTCCTSLISS
ncbi:MAG: Na/Pi cotransporter family protein, partial [Christensenellaceae bacterium]